MPKDDATLSAASVGSKPLTFGSLFAGIGGFDLGLERAGMRCGWQVEIDPYARAVLAKHWPDVRRWEDVRTFPPKEGEWCVDVICGGFPCQDISIAGKGAGLAGARSGLWYEYARIIGELRPRYVIVENVAALLARGMGTVLGDLSSLGYDAEWHVIPASAVGAPHRRERVWIVGICSWANGQTVAQRADANGIGSYSAEMHLHGGAQLRDEQERNAGSVRSAVPHANSRRLRRLRADSRDGGALPAEGQQREFRGGDGGEDVADANEQGLEGRYRSADLELQGGPGQVRPTWAGRVQGWDANGWWSVEPDVGRVAHGVPARVDRLRCLGNAVVPQIVEVIGRAIVAGARA